MTFPPRQRTSLPSLTFLDFYGTTEYLEEFVARIDLSALSEIIIKLFNDIFFKIPQLYEFISRLNKPWSPTSATVTLFSEFAQVKFFHKANPSDEYYALRNSCIPLDWQLSFVTQITSQLFPLVSSVHELTISANSSLEVPAGEEAVDSTQWLDSGAFPAIHSCDKGYCLGEATFTGHVAIARSGDGGHGHGSITRADHALPLW
jgi:hypothetical protein